MYDSIDDMGLPLVLKSRRMAYDGRGSSLRNTESAHSVVEEEGSLHVSSAVWSLTHVLKFVYGEGRGGWQVWSHDAQDE